MAASKKAINAAGFPTITLAENTTLYRLFGPGPINSAPRNGWFFSSTSEAKPGRFDLPLPNGTCYFSTEKYGAFFEKFRNNEVITRAEVDSLMMLTAVRTAPLEIADMTSKNAHRFGISLDTYSGDDYSQTQAWELALFQKKLKGVMGLIRHDGSGHSRNVGLFSKAGPAESVSGWSTTRERLTADHELLEELKKAGIHIQDGPYDVDTTTFVE